RRVLFRSRAARSGVASRTHTASTPCWASSPARYSAPVSTTGGSSVPATRPRGGSKVTATRGRPSRSACSRAWWRSLWWPRWTPSKVPTITAERFQSAGTSPSPRQSRTLTVLPSAMLTSTGRQPSGRPASWYSPRFRFREGRSAALCSTPRSPPASASREDHHGLAAARPVLRQGQHPAVGGEQPHPTAMPARGDPVAVDHTAGFARAEPTDRERRSHRFRQRHHGELGGQLVQGGGLLHGVGPYPGAAQRGQVPAHAEVRPQVTRQGTDVGAAGAGHAGVNVDEGAVRAVDAAEPGDGELVHGHLARFQFHRLACPGTAVGALPPHFDRTDLRRNLVDHAGERAGPRVDRGLVDVVGGAALQQLSLRVVGGGGLAEADCRLVDLLRQR